jgi:hypothetical protein
VNIKKRYPDLIPQLRAERFTMALLEQLIEINEKLNTLVKKDTSNVQSNQETAPKKTRKKAEVK